MAPGDGSPPLADSAAASHPRQRNPPLAVPPGTMGRALRLGLYSPFFGSTLGGGEKYLGVTAEAIRDAFPEHSVEIVSPVPIDRELYQRMLDIDLDRIRTRGKGARGNAMLRKLNEGSSLRRRRNTSPPSHTD